VSGETGARPLTALEDVNAKLKKLLAEQILDLAAMKDLVSKTVWSAPLLQGFRACPSSLRKCIRPLISQPHLATRP